MVHKLHARFVSSNTEIQVTIIKTPFSVECVLKSELQFCCFEVLQSLTSQASEIAELEFRSLHVFAGSIFPTKNSYLGSVLIISVIITTFKKNYFSVIISRDGKWKDISFLQHNINNIKYRCSSGGLIREAKRLNYKNCRTTCFDQI